MNQNIENALKQAYALIEAGNLEDAKALLRPIIESEKDSADVWWLYSHAVSDAETARLALTNVLRIDSNHADARNLLMQLEAQQKREQTDDILEMGNDPSFVPPMPSFVPGISPLPSRTETRGNKGIDSSDDLPDEMFDDEEPEAFYRRPLFYIPLISLLLVAALAIVIIKPFAVNSPATQVVSPTAQSNSLETPTSEVIISDASTPTSTVESLSDLSSITSAFSEFALPSTAGISFVDTSLGKTLGVSLCTTAGKAMRELLPKAMETLAKASTDYSTQAQIVGVKMLDCGTNSTLLWIGVSIEDAISFAKGTLSDKEFQAKWQPIK